MAARHKPCHPYPALDTGLTSATNGPTDQRGMSRVLRSGPAGTLTVDIGAVEYSTWLVGADISGVDPDLLVPDSIYDGNTVFPGSFDPASFGMLRLQSQAEMDALVAQGEMNVTGDPETYGLYTESAFQALALDRPFLTYDSVSNKFTLTIGVLQAPDLFTTFSNLTGFTTFPYPGSGQINIEFDPPNSDVRFFEVYGTEPTP
jgi:hypothetical protein